MRRVWKEWSPRRRRLVTIAVGAVVGAALGFAYYRLVGCSSGGCPITSSPWISSLYGSVIGALVGGV
ncbi:MAG: hypothetical protein JXB32_09005 [Deltaproteobacteria bacterium]|nr:hypothetical protein [Deltaproteobacteria bacterium]